MDSPDLTRLPAADPSRAYRYRDGLYAADLVTAALVHLDFFSWLAVQPGISRGSAATSDSPSDRPM